VQRLDRGDAILALGFRMKGEGVVKAEIT